MDKIKQFIKKYCQGYQGWSKERTLSATKDLKSLMDSKWISVKDELPGKKRNKDSVKTNNMLLYVRQPDGIEYYTIGWRELMNGYWHDNMHVGDYYITVTHWQLLPQPPKEE